jgi:C-terminal processing protease CtpA/Prc
MKTRFRSLILLLVVLFTLVSCKKNEDNTIEIVNQEIYKLMKINYLWNTFLPTSLNTSSYATPADLMDALRYDVYDRWSVVITKEEFNQYFVEGTMIGHGFMLGLDEAENIRIAFVYPTTQAYTQGVRRGWILSKVNGTVATSANVFTLLGASEIGVINTITFIDGNGTSVSKTLTKEEIIISPVVHYEILHQGTDKIGYLVFQDFIDAANDQLDEVFDSFNVAGINEIIVDMRYNGGGSVDVAEHLASWLIGKDFGNQPFIKYQHNLNLAASEDTTINLPTNAAGLSLDRIFFIGTENTASASELVINGVKPYVESILAGSATHGKPVGMYPFIFINYDYVVLPVCFKYSNANDEGDFYDGLQPTLPADDDLTKDFGDPDEASLKTVLDYIETGAVPVKITKSVGYRAKLIESDNPVNPYLKAY